MKQNASGVVHRELTVGESPTSPTTDDSRSEWIMARRQWGSVSILAVDGSTSELSWCSHPAWFSSDPW